MPQDPRVNAYIAAAEPFARPILEHLRGVVHRAAPDLVEAIKWGMPMFLHDGRIVANMAAFQRHASFGTWRRDGMGLGEPRGDAAFDEPSPGNGMGSLGKLTGLSDLPDDAEIIAMVREAIALAEAGGSMRRNRPPKPPPETPADLRAALDAVPAAAAAFEAFPPGCRREYIDWITEAKRPETRARRLAQTVEWCAQGKRRNWQYESC